MKPPVLSHLSPTVQTIVLLPLIFVCLFAAGIVAHLVIRPLTGINILTEPEVLRQFGEPGVTTANRVLMIFNQLGFFLVPALIFAKLVSYREENFLRNQLLPKNYIFVLLMVVITVASVAPIDFVYSWNQGLDLPAFLSGTEEEIKTMEAETEALTNAMMGGEGIFNLLGSLFIFALLPGICEEFFFRGTIQTQFYKSFRNKHLAIWMAAFVFSFIHLQFLGFFPRFFLGAMLGYVFFWTGNIWYSVIIHFLNNAGTVLIAYYYNSGKITAETAFSDETQNTTIPLILSFLVLAGSLYYIGKRSVFNDWKPKTE